MTIIRTAPWTIETVLEEIVTAIVPRFAPARILLFGSRARGDHREDSDYDIMVVVDVPDPRAATAIHRLVSRPERSVDVIATTTEDFERRRTDVGTLEYVAVREGRVLYDREPLAPVRVVREPAGVPESYAEWVERAASDFRMMELSSGNAAVADGTTFHAHQCAEKYLKAKLVLIGVAPPRTHSLAGLLELSDPRIRANAVMRDACALLDGLWSKARYPEQPLPTVEEAADAVRAARRVRVELGFS